MTTDINHHILSVLVQNRPGVLARVAGLFARRDYNIFSLAVAPAEEQGFSRITIVVDVDSSPLEQITKQLFKLIEVVKISELDPRRSVERELLLATVRVSPENRGQIVELATIFEGKILAVGVEAITISLDGHPDKLDDFEELLERIWHRGAAAHRAGGAAKARSRGTLACRELTLQEKRLRKGWLRWPRRCTTRRTPIRRSFEVARWPSSAMARRATLTRST